MGAYYQLLTPGIPELGGWVYMGPYDPEAYWFEFRGVLTNATPTDAYRGAGRPEATYVLERLVDALRAEDRQGPGRGPADELPSAVQRGDDVHLRPQRRLGQLRAGARPGVGAGRLPAVPEGAAVASRQRRRPADRDRALDATSRCAAWRPSNILGALRYAAGGWDAATIGCLPTGKVVVATGTSPHGQGHETTWSQIVADGLGVTPDDIEVLHGDTQVTPLGMDTYGSRSRLGRRRRAALRAWRRSRRRRGRSRRTSWRSPRTTSSTPTARSASRALPTRRGRSPSWRCQRVARARPARRDRAEPGCDGRLRPAELHVAGGHAHLRGRGRHGDRRRPTSCATWPSTTAAR